MPAFHLVDAFTTTAFRGNRAGVVLLAHGPVDAQLAQAVAAEVGVSETAFLHPEGDGWRLRWWTPTTEVDLCGHATLAAAHVLVGEAVAPATDRLRFHTRSGLLTATHDTSGRVWLELPSWPVADHPAPDRLTALLGGVPGRYLGRTTVDQANDVVEVADITALDAVDPDLEAIAGLGSGGLIVTSPGERTEVAMRYFAPALGVDEDPVTGSAACTVAPLWADRLGRAEVVIEQRSQRGGQLWTRLASDRVEVGGHAVTTIRGELLVTPM